MAASMSRTNVLKKSAKLCSLAVTKPVSKPAGRHTVTLVPGDGVGPEMMASVQQVFKTAGVPINFEEHFLSEVHRSQSASYETVLESFKRNGVGLKGIISSPHTFQGTELQTLNMKLRRDLDLFANVVLVRSLPGYVTRHNNLDFCVPGVIESLKIVTAVKSKRIAKFAFDYAMRHNRKKVTAVHKANIMKLADGMFLKSCEEVAKFYPSIKLENMIIDNCCMQGARHSFATAVGKNIANPTAVLLAGCNMLRHMSLDFHAQQIETAIHKVVKGGKTRTQDMGGYATTVDFTNAIVNSLQ
ncbi:IDH3B-like protein [Mya arenaria]|uniref:IDH3B-like protein n=1 Tax=Mya arenaria TaxID=6604 RepID=A0ABY7GFI8_MYAAR|nr:IDH3B-like protein [Mya arenaria]WAR32003.1 IDH3B-like protein [Mya arenaria]